MRIQQQVNSALAELRDRIGGLPQPVDPEADIEETGAVMMLLYESVAGVPQVGSKSAGTRLPNRERARKAFEAEAARTYRSSEQFGIAKAVAEASAKDSKKAGRKGKRQ